VELPSFPKCLEKSGNREAQNRVQEQDEEQEQMTLTIELTPEQEAALQAQATAAGMEASEYARLLLASDLVNEPLPTTDARQCALASEHTLSQIWDTAEEDAAWAHL
jgi:hypothetical protein